MSHKYFGGHHSANQHNKRKFFNKTSKGRQFSRANNAGTKIDVAKFINKPAGFEASVEAYVPQHRFSDFKVSDKLKQNISAKGYKTPTPIQDRTINTILEGKDVVGIANTGTGKTAAFLVPLINKVLLNRNEKVLIVVPTRELALQIQEEFLGFSRMMNLFSVICIGGANIRHQIFGLKRHHNFVIGTPGRLKDLINQKYLNLGTFRNLVLDEADRMLDMGFIHDMKFLVAQMPKERQSLFFSATMSREIQELVKDFLKDPVTVSVKLRDTAANVEQDVIRVARDKKMEVLHGLLMKQEFKKVLIFGRTKHGVEKLSVNLVKRGIRADSIHGNKSQNKRQNTLKMFKADRLQVLVATDVAARGLDIEGVSHVINYDVPSTYEDYIHRIGRTGRADQKGKALTFVE